MRLSALASPADTKAVLQRFGLSAKKALGQNFLVDDNVIRHIVELAQLEKGDLVLEIGPGIGTLTCALLSVAEGVVAVERDRDLIPVLSMTCEDGKDRLRVLNQDALKLGQDQLDGLGCAKMPSKMVSNLPYSAAATIVLDYFERFEWLKSATVMVQSEVADRMQAASGVKDYGAYTVKLSLHAKAVGSFNVPPSCFYPRPHVSSTVIRLDRTSPHFEGNVADAELIEAAGIMADAAFFQRRKTLGNSLSSYFSFRGLGEVAARALDISGLDPKIRGERLALDDYLRLGNALLRAKEEV